MGKPRIGHLVLAPFVAAALAGCHRSEPPSYPTWAPPVAAYTPVPNSGNAFDEYALVANEVENTAQKHLLRVSFYPDQRKAAMDACEPALARLAAVGKLPCDFKFVPRAPFKPAPYQRGWRLLGRVLQWRVQDACHAKDFDKAIDAALLATRFGFDLTGGGATDAALGLSIVDDARAALAPSLPEMGAGQLARLGAGIQELLARKPSVQVAVGHEGENAKLAVQALQDAFAKGDLKEFQTNLGPDVKDAIEYLDDLRNEEAKRVTYFQELAKEGDDTLARTMANAALPFAKRQPPPKPDSKAEKKPWRRFARHFFSTCDPLLKMNDRTLARTRLLAISAEIYRVAKTTKAFPRDLAALPPDLVTDPYTGTPFPYHSDPSQFSVYSVGEDLRDDNGDSDPTFLKPDLRLEASN